MSIPSVNPILPIPGTGWDPRPYTNIIPFTYVWGRSHADTLEDLRRYVNKQIVEHLNVELDELTGSVSSIAGALVAAVNLKISEVEASLTEQTENVDAAIAQLTEDVNNAVDQIINATIEITAPIIATILDNPASAPRILLDTLFASKSVETDITNRLNDNRVFRSFNPKNYGAIGNGIADDTAAITNAIAAANAAGARDVWLAPGEYLAELNLTGLENVRITGPGTLVQKAGKPVVRVFPQWGAPQACGVSTVLYGQASSPALYTRIDLTSNDYRNISQGDVYRVESQDIYPWSVQALGAGATIWQAEFLPVFAVALAVTGVSGTTPTERNTVTGQTSGATARIQSYAATDGTSGVIMMGGITTNFVPGETLVNGSNVPIGVAGATFLLSARVVIDSYATLPVVRKIPKTRIDLDVTIRTTTDQDAIMSAAGRGPAAIDIIGAYKPNVKATVYGSFSSAVRFVSCFAPVADMRIDKLPNIASSTESGYGYGIEIAGATDLGMFTVNGTNLRHAFTTNVTSGTIAANAYWGWGTVKYNTVHDSIAHGAFASGFDTHEGAYFTTFIDCISNDANAGSRFQSTGTGFTNRGFGTRFINCIADNCEVSFSESGALLTSNFPYVNAYINCEGRNFLDSGWRQGTDAANTNSTIRIEGCRFSGATSSAYTQTGIQVRGGRTDIIRTSVTNLQNNGKGIWVLGTGTRLYIDDFTYDLNRGVANTFPIYVQATCDLLAIMLFTIRSGPGGEVPANWFRNQSGNTDYRIDKVRAPGIAPAGTMQTVAGTPTLTNISRTLF